MTRVLATRATLPEAIELFVRKTYHRAICKHHRQSLENVLTLHSQNNLKKTEIRARPNPRDRAVYHPIPTPPARAKTKKTAHLSRSTRFSAPRVVSSFAFYPATQPRAVRSSPCNTREVPPHSSSSTRRRPSTPRLRSPSSLRSVIGFSHSPSVARAARGIARDRVAFETFDRSFFSFLSFFLFVALARSSNGREWIPHDRADGTMRDD